jgi:nucleoside-diphosphate-sugar epimerase
MGGEAASADATHRTLTALVTGGGGFLGRGIVELLLGRGHRVRSFSRGPHPELEGLGAEVIRGDVSDPEAVSRACGGCDVVFHAAGLPSISGSFATHSATHVRGTENVIAACRGHGITKLILTSSASVVFDGTDMEGVDESVPYPKRYEAHYPESKAIAEQMVLAANAPRLATVALRPHLIWGPGDTQLLPRIIARARSLRRIGPVDKKVDCTYIDNAADAHLLAYDRLAPGSPVAGKAYFISQAEPRGLWELVNALLGAAGLPPVTKTIPRGIALAVGACQEAAYALLRLRAEPPLTRFLVRELSTAHWFDISAARRDLGYEPRVSIDEGLRRLSHWLHKPRSAAAP